MIGMYPDNIIGIMFTLLESFMHICNQIVENFLKTPVEILTGWLDNSALPDWLVNIIQGVVAWHNPILNNVTLFDLLVGSALILVLFGAIFKFATDIVGL